MIDRLAAISGAVFMDAVRRKVVYVVVFFGLVLALMIPTLPSYGLGVVAGVYREVALALTFAAGLVLALALSANRVPSEIERRTLYNVLTRPVRRLEYLVGTWLGVMAVMAAVIAGFTVIEQVVGLVRYQDAMWRLWQGAFAIWLELGVVSALAVAVSARTGPIVVVVSALTFLFAGHARDSLLGAEGPALLRAVYPSLDTFNIINPVAHGSGVGLDYMGGMLLAFVGWAGVLLLLGVLAFDGRDL
jgi:ABC-type transport system involved in multi-copper enzyme maturation permease subunit